VLSAKQIRASRAILGWSQQDLADAVGLSKPTIVDAERNDHQPRAETLGLIQTAFEDKGLEIIPGGVKERDDILKVYQGSHCTLEFVDKMQSVLRTCESKEILYYGADQARSSDEILKKFIAIKEAGGQSRYLIKNNDTYIMEELSQYRWMPDKLWLDSDVKVIFADIVAYVITWQAQPKIISFKDKRIADAERKVFNFVWNISAKPTHSTALTRY
jgi:transcriptional regulator with XRE-family HTH domain